MSWRGHLTCRQRLASPPMLFQFPCYFNADMGNTYLVIYSAQACFARLHENDGNFVFPRCRYAVDLASLLKCHHRHTMVETDLLALPTPAFLFRELGDFLVKHTRSESRRFLVKRFKN